MQHAEHVPKKHWLKFCVLFHLDLDAKITSTLELIGSTRVFGILPQLPGQALVVVGLLEGLRHG